MRVKRKMTAAELLSNPETAEVQKNLKIRIAKKIAYFTRLAQPITDDLFEAGIFLSFADLVNHKGNHYPEAVPILLKHFHGPYPDNFRSAIARWLAANRHRSDAISKLLIDEFEQQQSVIVPDEQFCSGYKFQIANAIADVAVENDVPRLCGLVDDPKHGWDRFGLVFALGRFRKSNNMAKLKLRAIAKQGTSLGASARRALRGKGISPNSKLE